MCHRDERENLAVLTLKRLSLKRPSHRHKGHVRKGYPMAVRGSCMYVSLLMILLRNYFRVHIRVTLQVVRALLCIIEKCVREPCTRIWNEF